MELAYRAALNGSSDIVCPRRSVTPPNRLETRNWDLIAAIARCRDSGSLEALRDQLREISGRAHVVLASSARSAIAQVLSMLPQKEVVMPAFTCYAVRRAAEVAGKRIIYVDTAGKTLNATSEQYALAAKPGRILLPTHLFGIPVDIARICELARDRNCLTIEDAAGAFPARLNGRMLGTFGDFGIISFERSKRVPSFRGGAIIVNNETAIDPAKLALHRVVPTTLALPVRELLSSLAYNVATIPWLYGRAALPRILRQYSAAPSLSTKQGSAGAVSDRFYNREFHSYQAALVTRMLRRTDKIRKHIERLVSIYHDAFRNTSIQTFVPPLCDAAGLLRFPIAFPGRARRDILLAALRRGLYFETNFERPLPDEVDHGGFPNSTWAAQNVVLLPLYTSLSPDAAKRIASEVLELDQEVPCRRPAPVTCGTAAGVPSGDCARG